MDAPEKGETSTRAAPRRTNCRLRLLPRYLFSGSAKLIFSRGIVRADHPPGDYPLLQESASMRNFFFVYVFPRGNIFSQLSCPFTHGNEFCWLSAGKITFFLLISLSLKKLRGGSIEEDSAWKDCAYSCGARNYLLLKEDKRIEGMWRVYLVQIK